MISPKLILSRLTAEGYMTVIEQAEPQGLRCPKCAHDTRVSDSRPSLGTIRRRRICLQSGCGHRFTTYEIASPEMREGYGFLQGLDGFEEQFEAIIRNAEAFRPKLASVLDLLRNIERAGRPK